MLKLMVVTIGRLMSLVERLVLFSALPCSEVCIIQCLKSSIECAK